MYNLLHERLSMMDDITPLSLGQGKLLGVEKETLRVQPNGAISQAQHPQELGAALTNPYITTDYSEALLEIVTPPLPDIDTALGFLGDAHRYIYPRLPENEFLWSTSMPCILHGSESIPIGYYGKSNAGLMKHVYRKGLGLRYGKAMQTIAGVHFNFSWPDAFWDEWRSMLEGQKCLDRKSVKSDGRQEFITAQYFHMTRNLLRFGWLVPYLFGASPAICRTFLNGAAPLPGMDVFRESTYFEPFGTSLRMGDIGYQYRKDSDSPVNVSYACVHEYVRDLLRLVSSNQPRYEEIGLRDSEGRFQQLNTNRLQIENEYYSSVRPKQIPHANEMPLMAMAHRGIRYLELRSIDVNVFEPLGVDANQLHFLEVFMLFSLLHESPGFNTNDVSVISNNMSSTAHRGRDPELQLHTPCGSQRQRRLTVWGKELLDQMSGPAALLDQHNQTDRFSASLALQLAKMNDPELTPSARVLREIFEQQTSYYEFARGWSLRHFEAMRDSSATDYDEQFFARTASESLQRAEAMERESTGTLEDYLDVYFSQLGDAGLDRYRAAQA